MEGTIQSVDNWAHKAAELHVGLGECLVELVNYVEPLRRVNASQLASIQELLEAKKNYEKKVLAHEARIAILEAELNAANENNTKLDAQLKEQVGENLLLKGALQEQNDVWKTKFDTAQAKIDDLTVALAAATSQAQAPPRQARRPAQGRNIVEEIEHYLLPEKRQAVLDAFPGIGGVPEDVDSNPSYFSRQELMTAIGGGSQSLVANIGKAKARTPISVAHDITGLLYPYRDLNPWLPKAPGEHGYMFVGLHGPGCDDAKFKEHEVRAMFIPVGTHWKYYGHYEIFRDPENDLSVQEWSDFSEEFKLRYAELTLMKRMAGNKFTKHKRDNPSKVEEEVRKIVRDYDSGSLRVPVVEMKCVKYDQGLVPALQKAPKTSLGKRKKQTGTRKTKSSGLTGEPSGSRSQPRPRKRMRAEREDSPEPATEPELDDDTAQSGRRRSTRTVRLVVRGPRSGDLDLEDIHRESSVSDPDEYHEDSESESDQLED